MCQFGLLRGGGGGGRGVVLGCWNDSQITKITIENIRHKSLNVNYLLLINDVHFHVNRDKLLKQNL